MERHPAWQVRRAIAITAAALAMVVAAPAHAQLSSATDVNLSRKAGDDTECAISKNPSNKLQLFALCNTAGAGLMAARSTDGGLTWTYPDADKTIADGDAGQGAAACCDPTLAWDTFGNLYITYIDAALSSIVTLLSTDAGLTFTPLASFGPASVDQPTVVAAETTAPGAPVAVWIVWNQGGQMMARGAAVTGLGAIAAFNAAQTIPGTASCTFGDVAIAPSGAVVQTCQVQSGENATTILVSTDADGLGGGNFGPTVTATTTNVGTFDTIPAQSARTVDAEAGLAFDRNPGSAHAGRLYLVYTEEVADESNDTDIMVRFSDDTGATWSPPTRVNDDATTRSQFLPRIATNRLSGNVAVCWHDCRASATNTAAELYCSLATPSGATPAFFANARVSDGASTSNGAGVEFGDYAGMDYFQGLIHPIWGDTSNSGGGNPGGTAAFDAYTDRVSGGAAANEGDPHMTTVEGVHYDFQAAGEFTVLRDADGMEIQTRQSPVATASVLANSYTGLSSCVSLNTALAARIGRHRLSYEPKPGGTPDPSGLELRVDGQLVALGAAGVNLGLDGRISKAPIGDGIQVEFANGTVLTATAHWWSSQSRWYLNIGVRSTPALEGIMGARARGSWLPAMPDGSSLGARPTDAHQRYVDLYERFGRAWRVTDKTSLFDYAPGTSTDTFTLATWPTEGGPCVLPAQPPVAAVEPQVAQAACRGIEDRRRNGNCAFDVQVMGEVGFAKAYEVVERLARRGTATLISAHKNPTQPREPAVFTAAVALASGAGIPAGSVVFTVDGKRVGEPVALDARGRASMTTAALGDGAHRVSAAFAPAPGEQALPSTSLDEPHTVRVIPGARPPVVRGCRCAIDGPGEPDAAVVLLLAVAFAVRRRGGWTRRWRFAR